VQCCLQRAVSQLQLATLRMIFKAGVANHVRACRARYLADSFWKQVRPRPRTLASQAGSGQQMTAGVMYNWRVAAVHNALARRGKAEGPLTIEDLTSLGHLDQYHYLGTEACDELIQVLGLEPGVTVLDVGSGIGGPARYIAHQSGCSVTGVELQADLAEEATALTKRVGLQDRVDFLIGDFADVCRSRAVLERFDHVTSLLTFCHFPNRADGLKVSWEALKPGGTVFFEDLTLMGPAFTEQEQRDLAEVVGCPSVTSPAVYVEDLQKAGFVDIEVVDMSAPWKTWTKARHVGFRQAQEETVKLHGLSLFESRCAFYEVIDRLFQGNLGGVRITARKRGVAEEKLYRGRASTVSTGTTHGTPLLNEFGTTVDATYSKY